MKHQKGFTLIEIAVVLTIVALLIGGLLIPLTTQIDVAKIQSTEKTLAQVKTALTRYAVANNRLPCPSDNPEVGIEVNTVANCTIEGNLPWVNLGVGRYDAWGNPLRYRVVQQYTDHIVESNGDLNRDLNRDNLSPTSNTPSVKDAQGNNLVNANDLVAIILSDGKNGETEQQALREQFSFNIGQNTYLFKGLKGISDLLLAPAFAREGGGIFPLPSSDDVYTKCNAVPDCDDLLNVITIPHLRAEMRQGPTTIMVTSSKPVLDDTVYNTPTTTNNSSDDTSGGTDDQSGDSSNDTSNSDETGDQSGDSSNDTSNSDETGEQSGDSSNDTSNSGGTTDQSGDSSNDTSNSDETGDQSGDSSNDTSNSGGTTDQSGDSSNDTSNSGGTDGQTDYDDTTTDGSGEQTDNPSDESDEQPAAPCIGSSFDQCLYGQP